MRPIATDELAWSVCAFADPKPLGVRNIGEKLFKKRLETLEIETFENVIKKRSSTVSVK